MFAISTTLDALRLTAALLLAGWLWQSDGEAGGKNQRALLVLAVFSDLLWLGAFAADATGAAPWSLNWGDLEALAGTDIGQRWFLRLDLALALGLGMVAGRGRLAGLLALPWLALLGMDGHASGIAGWQAVLVRFTAMLHIVTAALWIGGGLALARHRLAAPEARRLSRSYGEIALNAAILLVLTGGLQFLAIAGDAFGAIAPGYLALSGAKLALFVILLAVGAYNRYRLAPLLHRLPIRAGGAMSQSLLRAALVGVAAILLGSLLGGTEPGPP
ncbi:Putative copper export protein [Arboricoccus pini]|uniref:Putative copper export protein n=1 Tax=Arboricoccus pini TaxID=1963835 RepID=A0A212RR49_9PROT|nr:CopD family protein [Arboricoccus pini]SNB74963.1 Putative copper export protein [Arboricoccus pini]